MSTNTGSEHIAVVGAGSWATALVQVLTHNGHYVHWALRTADDAAYLAEHGHNPRYLPDVPLLRDRISATHHISVAVETCDLVLFCVPSAYLSVTLEGLRADDLRNKVIISSIKGLEATSGDLPNEFLRQRFDVPQNVYANILGPGHAEELAYLQDTFLTVVSRNDFLARNLCGLFARDNVYMNTSEDVAGAELAAVLKNVYAMACGVADGLEYGDNFQAILVSAALREMMHILSTRLTGRRDPTEGIYAGDLLVTCYSKHSRNRRMGHALGQGRSVDAILAESNMVAEGYHSCKHLFKKYNIEEPILESMYNVLYNGVPARSAMEDLKPNLMP